MSYNRFDPGCCCCNCHNKDVVLLTDSTGSMAGYINNVKAIFAAFKNDFGESQTCKWCVAEYRDYEDGGQFAAQGIRVLQTFTSDFDAVIAAINTLSAGGGGDGPEQAFSALQYCAEHWTSSLNGGTDPDVQQRVIIWGGDIASWNDGAKNFPYPSRASVISVLQSGQIKVFGLNSGGAGSGIDGQAGLDNVPGQASAICSATGGQLFNGVSTFAQIRDAMCQALA